MFTVGNLRFLPLFTGTEDNSKTLESINKNSIVVFDILNSFIFR